jgi:hypothetical protein
MDDRSHVTLARRAVLLGTAAGGLMLLPGCAAIRRYSLVQAVRRMLELAAQRAFAKLTAPDGFWDSSVARLKLPDLLGSRGNVLASILSSALFKQRLQHEFNKIARKGAKKAAPLVADVIEKIGIDNARALLDGGPDAATAYLRRNMAGNLVQAMVPELADAIRISNEPLVGQALSRLTGVDVGAVAQQLAGEVDDSIWKQIGHEEAVIRADPAATRDPILTQVLGGK